MDILQNDPEHPGLEIRYTEPGDAPHLKQWLLEPGILRWFPMCDEVEIDDAVWRWIAFCRYKCSLTVVKDGVPCGIATLYLQPYKRIAHQCEFGIIIGSGYRDQGIGTYLLNSLLNFAKEQFKIELIHLQVYAENPAIRLYERFGFVEFGRQNHWIKEKEENKYVARIFMERTI